MESAATELAPLDQLSDRQQRGADCVICGLVLTAGDVVDLGPRMAHAHGTRALWYPRRHPGCTTAHPAAFRAVLDHTTDCPECLNGCDEGDELRRAERAARP